MKIFWAVSVALVVGAFSLPAAEATHPSVRCLDMGADTRNGSTNDDAVETIQARIGVSDAGHPPQQGCVTNDGGNSGGQTIEFEVTGAGDPDASNSPETADMACIVPFNSNSCNVDPPSTTEGTQTIRAWIDDTRSVEADMSEGSNEETSPGSSPEPDGTDVATWTWTRGSNPSPSPTSTTSPSPTPTSSASPSPTSTSTPSPSPTSTSTPSPSPACDPEPCPIDSEITIRHRPRKEVFRGTIDAEHRACVEGRLVKLWKVRRGPDRLQAKTTSDSDGRWRIPLEDAGGRYYAVAEQLSVNDAGSSYDCRKARSETIRV